MSNPQTNFPPVAFVKAKLLREPVYREDGELWLTLRAQHDEIRHYFRQIGQELVLDEGEGYAFIRQLEIEGEDRTRHSYIRGAWATVSQEDSAKARPEYLRNEGVQSVLLAVFANERNGEVATLVQILWELNEKVDERFAVAREDKTIKDHLANLGQTRELMKNLRLRGFEPFDSFSAYSKTFCSRLGVASETALEVFNQAIGVKEVGDINHFIRRHMLEDSDATDVIHNRLRPHFNELDACWRAIERAQHQLDALKPIADAHAKIEEAKQKRQHLQNLLDASPLFYAHRHLVLRREEAIDLAARLGEMRRQKQSIEEVRKRDEAERDAKLQEIAADSTSQSIARIEAQMSAADERRKSKQTRWNEFAGNLRTLNRLVVVESPEQFDRIQSEVSSQKGLLKGNRDSAQDKQVQQLMERQRALDDRSRIAAELDTLRKHRVLIPREFVGIREAVCLATKVPVAELPFAGELMEVKAEHREWTGAIERLLHQFGVSLLVPESHYVGVAEFINRHHLGLRFTFHRVSSSSAFRADSLADPIRVADRLHIFKSIRELISNFEKDEAWTRYVTDARNWFEFGVRELADADKHEVNYYSASSGKSGGQKAKLAFTILASAISAQYGLLGADSGADTFRLVVIDEVFARTDEANSQRALKLFQKLGLQLVVVNPFDAKGRIVEDFVDSFHLAVNPDGNNSKLRRASRAEYDAILDGAETKDTRNIAATSISIPVDAQP